MKSSQVAEILLIQAIESVDESGEIISFEERRKANTALEGEVGGSPLEAHYLRTQELAPHVKKRSSWLWHTVQNFSLISWKYTLILVGIAMIFGASFQVLDGSKQFHVLSFPLLGLLLWNMCSLSLLFFAPLIFRKASSEKSVKEGSWGRWATSIFQWVQHKWIEMKKPTSGDFTQQVAFKAFGLFWKEWSLRASRLLRAQATRALHLATVGFCASALLVAYLRGFTKAYKATAESTFFQPGQMKILLEILFAPSQLFLGDLPAMKSTISPAAPWIHHYALTLFLFVVVPRLLLFVWSWLQSAWLKAHLPLSLNAITEVPTLNIALASHTNVGKTSLARTLLRRDVGEVRDAEHVTRRRAGYFWINEAEARLRLWDTPGFGDAHLLYDNLQKQEGWAWLRSLQDPDLRFDREAALSLQEEADLILYLVPAHPDKEVEKTIRDEWKVLNQIQRPVICLLNRLEGASLSEEKKLLGYWQEFFSKETSCKGVLALDAFSRDAGDEDSLFQAIVSAVDEEKTELATTLLGIWQKQRETSHKANTNTLSSLLQELSKDSEIETSKDSASTFQKRAQHMIAEAQNKLLEDMGLKGEIRDRMIEQSEDFLRSLAPDRGEGAAGGVLGGLLGGLVSGVAADLLAGGLTFGGGAVLGAIAGAIGGYGAGEGYRKIKSSGVKKLVWDEKFLQGVTLRLTLLYLAAASFGRAKGEFTDEDFLSPKLSNNPYKREQEERRLTKKQVEYQARLLQAAETALECHWPFLWPLIEQNHQSKVKKLWEDLLPKVASVPAWVEDARQDAPNQGSSSFLTLETGCSALLHEAQEQWEKSQQS